MAYTVKYDAVFKRDYKKVMNRHPELKDEFRAAVTELVVNGRLPESYRPHLLTNPGGNYNGHIDFHLSAGKVDVVVLYLPHRTSPIIRLVRMGAHEELFQGPRGYSQLGRSAVTTRAQA